MASYLCVLDTNLVFVLHAEYDVHANVVDTLNREGYELVTAHVEEQVATLVHALTDIGSEFVPNIEIVYGSYTNIVPRFRTTCLSNRFGLKQFDSVFDAIAVSSISKYDHKAKYNSDATNNAKKFLAFSAWARFTINLHSRYEAEARTFLEEIVL